MGSRGCCHTPRRAADDRVADGRPIFQGTRSENDTAPTLARVWEPRRAIEVESRGRSNYWNRSAIAVEQPVR